MLDQRALDQIMQGIRQTIMSDLQAAGVEVSADDAGGSGDFTDGLDQVHEDNDKLISWNNTKVTVPAATDRPSIWDMSKIEDGSEEHDRQAQGAGEMEPSIGGAAPAPGPGSQARGYYKPEPMDENVAPYAAVAGAK